ncbi:MAG: hypothetical protein IBX69_15865 [Anaerolineales bacterium]|nr:hypothetical protein [Anaerolineales bacterium]
MPRQSDQERLQKAVRLIIEQPGHLASEYARQMGCHRQTFSRMLVQLEDRGFLLSEDEHGRLWMIKIIDKKNK